MKDNLVGMEDPKKRGKQHLKNKAKYKSKSQASKATPISTITPQLRSNWDRYRDVSPSTGTSIQGKDFSVLAEAPISKGSHFQFKSDAQDKFSVESTPVNTNALFNLDLNLLGLSIGSIPFYERCAIPENFFTETQLIVMNRTAKDNARLYEHSKENETQKGIKVSLKNENSTSKEHSSLTKKNFCPMMKLGEDDYKNKFVKEHVTGNSIDKVYPSVNKLNELEEELNRMTLMKDVSSHSPNIGASEYNELSSVIQKSSGDVVDHSTDNSRDKPTGSGRSLETESLQQWLDDVLED